ncbi:hypothetical protein IO90_17715 [Chryseobacterium sp. FH1]|nr:hypothetical protein IO90_17715 [Chryseobacterium sp. FH1]
MTNISCYSYTNTRNTTSFEGGKKYKITNRNGIKTKMNAIEVKNDTLIGLYKNQKIAFPINEITKSEKRRFS